MKYLLAGLLSLLSFISQAQSFNYAITLEPIVIPNLPGLHSYAFAQHGGKWLIIGGRKDGIHARQPVNSFPESQNNTSVFVIDISSRQFWSSSILVLPTGLKEQLQSTNMNYMQDKDTLVITGGYAFSVSSNNHMTFPFLTTINVPGLINAVVNGNSIVTYFKQLSSDVFAVTGGQLGKIGSQFFLIGGHRFDGRYNPMGNPTFTQAYTNQVRKFSINNTGTQVSFFNYSDITDPVHLRRRDYNLLPQVFPDKTHGYTISAGVFQQNADLPFLYPVDIKETGYTPVTTFNQYLSNYHSARACLYDSVNNVMHSLFFGGISQYYYQNGTLIQDPQVPFVRTISRVSREADGSLHEYLQPEQMPGFEGASGEFIPNHQLPHYDDEIIKLSEITGNTILLGHIFGGIKSPVLNPFAANQASLTIAGTTVYAVKLERNITTGVNNINGNNPYSINIFPNPASSFFTIELELDRPSQVYYYVTTSNGQVLKKGYFDITRTGLNTQLITVENKTAKQILLVTVLIDNKYYVTRKLMLQ